MFDFDRRERLVKQTDAKLLNSQLTISILQIYVSAFSSCRYYYVVIEYRVHNNEIEVCLEIILIPSWITLEHVLICNSDAFLRIEHVLSLSHLDVFAVLVTGLIVIVLKKDSKRTSLYKWPCYDHFWPFFCHLYVHLSQKWGLDGQFEVLNRSNT